MRKILLTFGLLAALVMGLQGQTSIVAGETVTSLSGVAATGAGSVFTLNTSRNFTWTVVYTGTPTSITIALQGSLDGTTYFDLGSSTSTANSMNHVVDKPVKFVRCNISVYTVNGSTTTCKILAN